MTASILNTFLDWWVLFGLLAQFIFFLRFVVQWYKTEKAGRTVVPIVFWYLSIVGSTMLLVYSLHRRDIVFILASVLSMFLYVRNLVIAKRNKKGKEKIILSAE